MLKLKLMLVEINPNYTRSNTGKTKHIFVLKNPKYTYLEDTVAIFINILNALPYTLDQLLDPVILRIYPVCFCAQICKDKHTRKLTTVG